MPRASPRLQQICVLAKETNSGSLCDRSFQQWNGIDKTAVLEFSPRQVIVGKEALYIAGELHQAGFDDFVIVATPRIPRDAAVAVQVLEGRRTRVVVDRERYHRSRVRNQRFWMAL